MSCSTNDTRRAIHSAYYHNECPIGIKAPDLCAFSVVKHLVFFVQLYCYVTSLYSSMCQFLKCCILGV